MSIRNIIKQIETILGRSSGLWLQTVGYAVSGVFQGLSIATLIPVLRELIEGDLSDAFAWLTAGAAAFLIGAVVLAITAARGVRTGVFTISDGMTRRLVNHVTRLPLGWFTAARSGQFSTLTADAQSAATFAGMILQQMVLALTTPATVLVVVLISDWMLGLSFLVLVPAGMAAYRWIQRVQGPARAAEAEALAEISGRILEFAHVQPVLRASGASGSRATDLLRDALEQDRQATVRTQSRTSLPLITYTGVIQAGVAIVTVIGIAMVLAGCIDIPATIAILVLVLRFAEPLSLIGPYGTGVQLAATGLRSIQDVLDTPVLPEPEFPVPVDTLPNAGIRFEDVTFRYDPDSPVLNGFSLTLEPGTVTALVGPSGAGKSTVLRLVARFWDVDQGFVRLGGADLRELCSEDIMVQVSMVSQHVYLFNDTILENVRLAKPDATDEQVFTAARAARLDEVVNRLPLSWDTVVGEGGDRLSGGEKQRVSIARAILKDSPILLLDEVTAALDAENEVRVSAAVTELAKDRTVLIVAHRLSTIAAADQIAFLEEGRVVELGTHDELLKLGGRYADFWAARSAIGGWRLR